MVAAPLREEPQKFAGTEVLAPLKSTVIINFGDLTARMAC